jgi:hypothetical protein
MTNGSPMSPTATVSIRARAWSYVMGGVCVLAACVTPVVATGTWLMLTDAGLAVDVAKSGDYMPLALAIADTLGEAFRSLLAYL